MFTVLWYSAIITCIVCFIPFLFFNWNSNKIYNKLVYGLLLINYVLLIFTNLFSEFNIIKSLNIILLLIFSFAIYKWNKNLGYSEKVIKWIVVIFILMLAKMILNIYEEWCIHIRYVSCYYISSYLK